MKILIFGDIKGIPQLLNHISNEMIVGIVAASIRPQYLEELRSIAQNKKIEFLVQPKPNEKEYPSFRTRIETLSPDIILVNSYSMILREDILVVPKCGCFNIHGALLPEYRGCNTTQWAIINGESKTGVTLHEMVIGIDEGAIIDSRETPIFIDDTWQSIHERVYLETNILIQKNLCSLLDGTWKATTQAGDEAHYYNRRKPEDGIFTWNQPILDIFNLNRALVSPLPGSFFIGDDGHKEVIDQYKTLEEIARLKYNIIDEWEFQDSNVVIKPIDIDDYEFLNNFICDSDNCSFNELCVNPFSYDYSTNTLCNSVRHQSLILIIKNINKNMHTGIAIINEINLVNQSASIYIWDKESNGSYEPLNVLMKFGNQELRLKNVSVYLKYKL